MKDLLKDDVDLDKWERGQYEVIVTDHAVETDENKALEGEVRNSALLDESHGIEPADLCRLGRSGHLIPKGERYLVLLIYLYIYIS